MNKLSEYERAERLVQEICLRRGLIFRDLEWAIEEIHADKYGSVYRRGEGEEEEE